jgi:hypothetical protein
MTNETRTCLTSRSNREDGEHLKSLLDTQRQITAHLLGDLRHLVLKRSSYARTSELKEIDRRLRQIERAHACYRQAETKVEILLCSFGSSLYGSQTDDPAARIEEKSHERGS